MPSTSTSTSRHSYSGVGSRKTPADILADMITVARMLAIRGFTLRSGAADGADLAFEKGSDQGFGSKEIYLPWRGFNSSTSRLYTIPEGAYDIARVIHPDYQFLRAPVKKLHARNVLEVLGATMDDASEFLLCWTPSALAVGGTRTALVLARESDVHVINFAVATYKEELKEIGILL